MTTAEIKRQQLIDWYYSTLNQSADPNHTPEIRAEIQARLSDIRAQIEALSN